MWFSVGAAPDNKLVNSPTGLSYDHRQSWITSDTWNKVDLNIVGGPLSKINEIVLVVNEDNN